jgi:hypothetical protein
MPRLTFPIVKGELKLNVEQGGAIMNDNQESPVARLHREEVERLRGTPTPPPELPAIDLPEEAADPSLAAEWKTFRQEVARLLAEGLRGRFVLVKAGHPLTVWDTLPDAARAGRLLFGTEPCLVQEIQPSLRPLRVGYSRLCRDGHSPSGRTVFSSRASWD